MTEVRCLLEKRSVLGEGPIWRPRENSLYWIDLKAPAIYCFDVITRQNRQVPAALGKTIGGMVFARDGRMIVTDAEGVHDLSAAGHRNLLVNPESDQVGNAFNDAKCDPKGRLWSGTADIGETRPSGSLYVIEGQGQRRVRRIDSGIVCSNGPAFSPDGRLAYFTDSFAQEIYCYDVDLDTGLIGGRKSVTGSAIGGMKETQEMIDFCAERNIVSDIEMVDIRDVNKAYERLLKNDVKYRFVIDIASLRNAA